ncbi:MULTISPECIES: hypothetical protein [Providencia]|uniref:hypothetical protein n=1 Tax=Providencia TaxID=586 RepID=UPI00083997D0|nr:MULTISPECIES: hypothetical protein [Providencia]MBP6120769.1 hypothetical protein [Providencia sp.]NIH23228.1 hypothetical protein [Providencia heimbachae]
MGITAEFIEVESRIDLPFLPVIDINYLSHRAYLSCKVIIYFDEEPKRILNIYSARDKDGYVLEQCFKEIKINQEIVAILHGVHVHLYNLETGSTYSVAFNDYVGHIYSTPNIHSNKLTSDFIVTTFQYAFLVNINSGIKWRSPQCAIDGVIIHEIDNDIIYGSGEWDPPGGWEPFQLDIYTGKFLHHLN